jgi:hypothetical protein
MGLKFRRGTNAQKSGSLAFGEPYVNTDLNTLMIGGAAGDITLATSTAAGTYATTGSNTFTGNQTITGSLAVSGNLTLGGALTIGDATADTINVVASISSSLIPNNDNTFDIGSPSKTYRTIYGGIISGSALEIMSGSNPEIRLFNKTTGIEYHIQNGDGGNFQIHNGTTGKLLFIFTSGSVQDASQDASFFGGLYVSESLQAHTLIATHLTGSSIRATNGFTGSIAATNGVISGSSQLPTLATTGSNTFKGNQTIIGSGAGFAAYISTSVNDATLGLDTTANVNALYFLKNGEKNFELSYDTTNANGIFRLLPYDNNSFFEIGNPSNSGANYVFISEPTYGNVLIGPGIGNGVSSLVGSTPATDKVQVTGNLYVSGAINANSFTGSIAATNGVVSGSSQVIDILSSLNTYTGSNDTTNTTQNTRLTRLEESTASLNSLTGSYAKTNTANVFTGNQTITGSLFISQDLVVAGSSSIQNISSSRLDIGDNIIQLNVNNPSLRFGGLAIYDSGSAGSSGSFLYDSLHDEFIFVHKGNGTNVTSSHFVLGPETYDNLGTETYLTNNRLPKGTGKEHIVDSNITDTGTLITLGSNTVVNGTLVASGTSLVSSSAQVIDILSSLNTYTGSNNTTNTTQTSRLDQLSTASGSAITRLTALEVETANLETFSSSALTRLSALEVETSNLESFSSSALTRLTNLEGTDITITLTGDVTGTGTITNLSNVSFATTVAANQVALGTDTTGDYVASLVAGTNITLSNNSGEGATPTIGLTNNTISGIALGSNLGTLTIGTGLSGTSYNGAGAVTIANTGVTSITGTANQVVANTSTGGVTLSLPQSIATSSNVQFNSLGIGMAASATAGRIDATNDIVAYSSSDIRFKENITPIENALDKISKISGNTYDWKAENKIEHGYEGNDVGVIAQEIEAVLPQLVQTRENGYKAVKYDKLVALLIEGIKEQQTQIHSLTIEIEKLKESKGL